MLHAHLTGADHDHHGSPISHGTEQALPSTSIAQSAPTRAMTSRISQLRIASS